MAKQPKPKITTGKFGGDDEYSYAVFIDGRPAFTRLTHEQLPHYKKAAENVAVFLR